MTKHDYNWPAITTANVFASVLVFVSVTPFFPADWGEIVPSLATLLAAFLGAMYAFKLQEKKEIEKVNDEQVRSGNRALFEVERVYYKFVSIRDQFVDKHRNEPDRHLVIRPIAGEECFTPEFDYDSLSFLFDSSDSSFLKELWMLEHDAKSIAITIRLRSEMQYDIIQPAVELVQKENAGKQIQADWVDDKLGSKDTQIIKMYTDNMINGVDNLVETSESMLKKLYSLLKEKHPSRMFIRMSLPSGDS